MSIASSPTDLVETLADVLKRLGGVSLDRIRMHPAPGTATVEDVVRIEARENRLFELVEGVLVEKVMGYQESRIAAAILTALYQFVDRADLGVVTGPDGMIRFPDNLVRMPDVAFVPWHEFPNEEVSDESVPEVVPDLAVEVLSKGNTPAEMTRKLREYFRAGVRAVWFVDPKSKTATVFSSPSRSKSIANDGTLDGGKVLPGFKLPLAQIFAKLKRSRKPGTRNGN